MVDDLGFCGRSHAELFEVVVFCLQGLPRLPTVCPLHRDQDGAHEVEITPHSSSSFGISPATFNQSEDENGISETIQTAR